MSLLSIMNRIIVSNKSLCLFVVGTSASVSIGRALSRSLAISIRRSLSTQSDSVGTEERRKKSALYTKTGDGGTSSLYNGERRPKADIVFEVLGHQDELNAVIGIAREHCALTENGLEEMLKEIQSRLFDLGAAVATPVQTSSSRKKAYTEFSPLHTAILEEWIDKIDSKLPPIINFVIPSGGMSSTHLNLARAVCRRAERCVYPLVFAEQVDAEVGRYLNRLSDFLFAAGRAAALIEGRDELLWIKAVLPSTISKEANAAASSALDSFNIASGSCAAMSGKSSKRKTIQSQPQSQSQSKDTASVAELDLSQHSTQTPAGSDTTFEGFDDEFFDPSAGSNSSKSSGSGYGSILGKGSDKNSHKGNDDDGSISSKSAASSTSKARYVRTSRIIPRVAALGSTRASGTSPTSPSTSSLNTRKPFSTRMDVSHTTTPKPLY